MNIDELVNRPYSQGTTVTNCLAHSGQPITSRSDECRLCRTDVVNVLSRALRVNEWLNTWKDDATKALQKFVNDAWRNIRVTIKSGWEHSGRRGVAFSQMTDGDGMSWTVVVWDGETEPELHKSGGLIAGEWADV